MLEEKKNLLKKNVLFALRRRKKEEDKDRTIRNIALALSVFFSVSIIALIYFALGSSDIFDIVVEGNVYLKDEEVIALSGLSTSDEYLLTIPSRVEKKIEADPLIKDAKVVLADDRIVRISVEENKLIAYTNDGTSAVLISEDDERIPVDQSRLHVLARLPYIEGFGQEELKLIEKNLADCGHKIINEISEIHKFPQLRFQNIELIMRDGNFIFTSAQGLNILNWYYDMESSHVSEKEKCYYFEDISGNAYTSACPWEPKEPVQQAETEEEVSEDE